MTDFTPLQSHFVTPNLIMVPASQGTWTLTNSSGQLSMVRTGNTGSHTIHIPVTPPIGNQISKRGCLVKSVTLWYVLDADVAAVTPVINVATLPANGAAMAAVATPAFTQ